MAAHAHGNKVDEALGLPGGHEFEFDLARLMENEGECIIAMVDVDCFDHVNKTFGRDEGDRLLIATGEHFKKNLPVGAKLYRYGGDEFGMMFPEGNEKETVFLALESMRAAYDIKLPDGSSQTITAGVASAPDDASTAGELIRKAEGALYRGKMNGRNRVCLSKEDKMVPKTTHYTSEQLNRLSKIAKREGMGEAALLREALDALLKKYDV